MEYEVELTLFIMVSIFLGVTFFLLFFFKPIRRLIRRNFTVWSYYHLVNKIALQNDFLLINQFVISLADGTSKVHIDHLLFGDKFIYVIKDRFYKGAIAAKEEDQSWVYFPKKNHKEYIDNPLIKNAIRCDRLSLVSGFDRNYFISIVLVNDDVFMTPFKSKDNTSVMVPLSKLSKFIDMNESKKGIAKFSESDLTSAVNDLAALNENGRK